MQKTLIGIAGEMYSGKTTAAEFLVQRFGARHLRFSKTLERLLSILDLEVTPENEHKLSVTLKELYGDAVLAHAFLASLEGSERSFYVFDDIRNRDELERLKTDKGFALVYIKSSFEQRYERFKRMMEAKGVSGVLPEDLKEAQQKQQDEKILPLEQFADFIITNDTTPEELHGQLTRIYLQSLC